MSGSSYFPLFKLPFVVVTPFSQTPKRKYPWPFQESNLEVPTCIYLFICLFMYLYPYIIVYFLFSAKCLRYHRFPQFYSVQYVLGNYRKWPFFLVGMVATPGKEGGLPVTSHSDNVGRLNLPIMDGIWGNPGVCGSYPVFIHVFSTWSPCLRAKLPVFDR